MFHTCLAEEINENICIVVNFPHYSGSDKFNFSAL